MQPYADRDSVKNIIYNDEGVDPYGRFFERQEKQGHCGLYAVRNLLETKDVTDYDLHEAAKRVASLTKDEIQNHADAKGYWSLDAISEYLVYRGFAVDYSSTLNFNDKSRVGYIVHLPNEFHYITVRRSKRTFGKVEICDSQAGIETVWPEEVVERSLREKWNCISISVY